MKNVDIEEPTSFLDHVYFGCTQRECKPGETIVFQLEQLKNYQVGKRLTQRLSRGLATWKDMVENTLSETVKWQTSGATVQSFKSLLG